MFVVVENEEDRFVVILGMLMNTGEVSPGSAINSHSG
jgi:hypothetical protein